MLGRDDPGAWALRDKVHGRLLSFGLQPAGAGPNGTYLDDGLLALRERNADMPLMLPRDRSSCAATTTSGTCWQPSPSAMPPGCRWMPCCSAAEDFHGVPHRLELVRERDGVRWYNNSIATAPERTMAAIRSFEEPIVLLLGGRDKDLPWEQLARLVHERVDHVVLFGEAAGKIEQAFRAAGAAAFPHPL